MKNIKIIKKFNSNIFMSFTLFQKLVLKNTHKTELKVQKNLQNLQNFQFSLSYFPPFKILYRIIVKKETFVKKKYCISLLNYNIFK